MFSKACEYGIRAMIFIAQRSQAGERVGIKEIAARIESPEAFTAKILQSLSRENFLHSVKGPRGGFELALPAEKISLAQVVKAIDGERVFEGCGLGLRECSEIKPCPLHNEFAKVRDQLSKMLRQSTLAELAEGLHKGQTFLVR